MPRCTVSEILDVLIVGAGLSGIGAARRLRSGAAPAKRQRHRRGSRQSIGGTWDLFRYPGVRSDSDMFTLGYDFKLWNDAKAIAAGPDILEATSATPPTEGGITRHIHFGTTVRSAEWSTRDACWTIAGERTDGGATTASRAVPVHVLRLPAATPRGYRPKFAGEADYRAALRCSRSSGSGILITPASCGRDRQRRHCRDAGAPRWPVKPPPTSPCCSVHRATWSPGRRLPSAGAMAQSPFARKAWPMGFTRAGRMCCL